MINNEICLARLGPFSNEPFEPDVMIIKVKSTNCAARIFAQIFLDETVPDYELKNMIDYAYSIVIHKLPKWVQKGLEAEHHET